MKLRNIIGPLSAKLRGDERGSMMPMFALAILPAAVLIGSALDYHRMSKADAQAKATVDAAVLAAQQQYSLNPDVDYQSIINEYVAENLEEGTKPLLLESVHVDSVELNEDGTELSAEISAKVPLFFMSLVGASEGNITARAAAQVGGGRLEVALVLDNTGSMQGNKIAQLKQAAQDLVRQIMPENHNDERVKVSVVPFADYVKLNDDERNTDGIDVPDDYTHSYDREVESCQGLSRCSCVSNNNGNGGQGYHYGWSNNETCTQTVVETFKWWGCMGSRPHDPDELNVRDEGYDTQGVPGLLAKTNNCTHIKELQRLSDKRADVLNSLGNMNANGYTYIPAGLMWGWRTLSPQAPFDDGVEYDDEAVKKVIVLMTDGENTRSMKKLTDNSVIHHEGDVYNHSASSTSNANQMTSEVCENIKETGITVFTIAFDVDSNSSVHTLLSNCAGNGGRYFDAQDGAQLTSAFHKISLALNNLRLTQ